MQNSAIGPLRLLNIQVFLVSGDAHELNYIKCHSGNSIVFIFIASGFDSVFLVFRTWHNGFLALMALGGILIGVALCAEELFILGGEGLVHQ